MKIDGHEIRFTNADKVLWPAAGMTKGQALEHYLSLADVLLPHLERRPLSLLRFPDGVEGQRFFTKHRPDHAPKWVRSALVEGDEGGVDFVLCEDRPTLAWLCQLAALEIHPLLAPHDEIDKPRAVVFDLDPGEPAGLCECCRVALAVRSTLEALDLQAWVKTSGSKGLHVIVPLGGSATYAHSKPFAKAFAQTLERRMPDEVVSKQKRELRRGKVLIDWSQNDRSKSTVAAYSLRARELPGVSTPVAWEEIEAVAAGAPAEQLSFTPAQVRERVERMGDLLEGVLTLSQRLPEIS